MSTSASRVFPAIKNLTNPSTHEGKSLVHAALKADHSKALLPACKSYPNSHSLVPESSPLMFSQSSVCHDTLRSRSIDHQYISQILQRKDWHLLLKHEFRAGRVPVNPQIVVSFLQNQADSFSCVKFYIWILIVEPTLEKNKRIRSILADVLYKKGPILLNAELLEVFKVAGFSVSEDFLCALIGSWGRLGLAKYCVEVFGQLSYLGLCPTTRIYNALLDSLVKSGSIDLAYLKFQEMAKDNCSPDRFTYNILIHGVCKAGVVDEALRLVKQMESSGYPPNVYTYTILVDGFCKAKRVDGAFLLLEEMAMKKVKPSEATYRSLVHGVFRSVEPKKAFDLLSAFLDRQVFVPGVALDTILYCLSKNGLAREAADFTRKLRTKGYLPDSSVCNITITSLIKDLPVIEVCEILDSFVSLGLNFPLTCYLALIETLFKEGNEIAANQYLMDLLKSGLVSNVYSYNMLLGCLCNAKLSGRAFEMFREMGKNGTVPSLATFNILIDGHLKVGDLGIARELLMMLLQRGFKPDNFTFSLIIDGLCKKRKMEDAFDCFAEMKEWGVVPNTVTYNILIRSLCVTKDVSRSIALFTEMQDAGIIPNSYSFNALIQSFCSVNNVDKAQELFLSMVRLGLIPDTMTYDTLIRSLSYSGRFDEAEKILFSVKGSGHIPDIGMCRSFVDTLVKLGQVKEAENVLTKCKLLGVILEPNTMS